MKKGGGARRHKEAKNLGECNDYTPTWKKEPSNQTSGEYE